MTKDFFGGGMPWSSSTTCTIVRNDRFRSCASFNYFADKRFYSRKAVSNCLMRYFGVGFTAGGTGVSGSGGLKSFEVAGVAPTPGQHRAQALDAVVPLGLLVTQLAAADFADHGQFEGQTVIVLTTPRTRLKRVFHDNWGKVVNIYSGRDRARGYESARAIIRVVSKLYPAVG